ncbi:plasma-membrane proton-efflux P-type ATPase [Nitratiruptor sp. SB155-2]|uniref:plasma-membrane proton-efflux P-type ATPase n=1 Tax=Nitratiruptor sp. (strain SB155-2) TaxID=387092 RepID=UPI0001587178|nr:plasma-membrane proton-efflux P-type ATPase [Nitratiruptor sp. SB155-2]BAF70041.1 H+-transporting P-type ATPase [Nitratiruptor sp. SB155-2]
MKETKYYEKLTSLHVAAELGTDVQKGLSEEEAKKRLQKYGPNEIPEKEEPLWHRIFRRFWGPIPWMIEIAAILAAAVRHWEEFYIILIMLFVNAFLDFYQESKALNAIKVLKKKLARKAVVLRDGKWQEVLAKDLVPGDIVKVKIGDIIPADLKIVDAGDYALVDQSALTGESLPVHKKNDDIAYSNTIVKQGEMVGIVVNTGLNTYFGKTVGLVAKAQREQRSHFQQMVIRVGNFLIAITIVMIAIIIYFGLTRHENPYELLVFSLVLTISAIPVALPTVLTVTMAIGALSLARKQAIVSRLAAIEELAGMDVLCSDKTGTLTKNQMTIAEPYVTDTHNISELFLYAVLASRRENNDPIEKPIFEYADEHGIEKLAQKYSVTKFVPFDPVRKRTEAVAEDENGKCIVTVKGAPQVVVALCDASEFNEDTINLKIEEFAENGFRTLGVAYKECDEEKFHFVGLIPLYDPPREDSKEAVEEAKAKGVEVKMVTGDNIAVARYIAKILGIGENILDIQELRGQSTREYEILAKVISQALLKVTNPDISNEKLELLTRQIVKEVRKELHEKELLPGTVKKHESEIIALIEQANGFAQVFPEDKYFIVDELQKADHIVGMTGDGVNDAPALQKADTGIAVSGATDAARAAADIILMAPGLRVIVDAIKEARVIFERMKSYTIFRIAETIRIIVFMTLAIVVFNFYPLTAIMIIVLALLNDIPILAIAYDNTKVRKMPVRWDMHEMLVLSSWLGVAGVISSFLIFYIVMVYLKTHPESAHFLPDVPIWVNMQDNDAWLSFVQSIFFAKMVIAGHGTIYNTRIDDWFFKRPWPSWILFGATFSTRVLGTIIAVYGFGLMMPIGWDWAIFMWAYALTWFVFNDAVKMAVLKYYRKVKGIEVI